MAEGMRFIRVNGRVVPVRDKKGGGGAPRPQKQQKQEKQRSTTRNVAVSAAKGAGIGYAGHIVGTLKQRGRLVKTAGKAMMLGNPKSRASHISRLTKVGKKLNGGTWKATAAIGAAGAFAGLIQSMRNKKKKRD